MTMYESPSTRRVWIEIEAERERKTIKPPSPSTRRVWIEMPSSKAQTVVCRRHPPHGGCGLKFAGEDDDE